MLEDINLKGARGVLVNITANEEVGLSEFTEVGNIIEEYASEDATVVIGCAIDPGVGDEMRVTVVATGLEGKQQVQASKSEKSSSEAVVAPQLQMELKPTADEKVEVAPAKTETLQKEMNLSSAVDEEEVPSKETSAATADNSEDKLSYLDIPAFLRRQAD